ncbi:MAG: hypothetical protein HGA47_03135, partial [Zoogloea sp.]|nr:hypothetical protein [Zoogloea sp.]
DAWIGGILIAFFSFGVSSAVFVGEVMVLNQKKKARRPASPVLAIVLGLVVVSSFSLGLYSALSC